MKSWLKKYNNDFDVSIVFSLQSKQILLCGVAPDIDARVYTRLYIQPRNKQLLLSGAFATTKDSVRLRFNSPMAGVATITACERFLSTLYEFMDWDPQFDYRTWSDDEFFPEGVSPDRDDTMLFWLEDAEPIDTVTDLRWWKHIIPLKAMT